METPKNPPNERKRITALRRMQLLDTLPDEYFDRITRLACKLFRVPIALITLVDSNRQWFKSQHGLSGCGNETERDISFCGHTILGDSALVVCDATADRRFADNPLVLKYPMIRFYAGIPLHSICGERVGALCLIDRAPRDFYAPDAQTLIDLGKMVEDQLVLIELAATDLNTGLSNWSVLTTLGNQVLNKCRERGQRAALIDIDCGKFESKMGNQDQADDNCALHAFTNLLEARFAGADVIARSDGDEFAILCSNTSSAQAKLNLHRLRRELVDSGFFKRHPKLSWNAACAQFDPASDADLASLLRDAQLNMHLAQERPLFSRIPSVDIERPMSTTLVTPNLAKAMFSKRL